MHKRISKQVQVFKTQLTEVTRQSSELVMCSEQEPQLCETADVERQTNELVVVQLEVDQLFESTKLHGERLQSILTEVQHLECPLQGGQAEGFTEGLQVVVVKDELRETTQVADGGRKFLDVVVAKIQPAQS